MVLFVEDETDLVAMAETYLRRDGFTSTAPAAQAFRSRGGPAPHRHRARRRQSTGPMTAEFANLDHRRLFEHLPSPYLLMTAHHRAHTAGQGTPGASGTGMLLVDDNTDLAEMYAIMLRRRGDTVTVATTAARTRSPSPAQSRSTCDLALGEDIDGYEIARRLRRGTLHRDSLLVAVSGFSQDGDRERSRAAGFDAHSAKPLESRRSGCPAGAEVHRQHTRSVRMVHPRRSCTRPSWSPRQAKADACDLQLYDVGTAVLRLVQHRGFPAAFPAAMIRVEQEGRAHGHREVR